MRMSTTFRSCFRVDLGLSTNNFFKNNVVFICTDMNGSPFFLTLISFYQVTGWAYFLPSERWAASNNFIYICVWGGGGVPFLMNQVWVFGFMGAGQLGLDCCWAFFYLGQGMWGIWCMCFMSFLKFLRGYFESPRALSDCMCMAPHTPIVLVIRGLTFHATTFNVWMTGSYLFGSLLW